MGRAGRTAPLMSPGLGDAQSSSLTSLRNTPRPPHPAQCLWRAHPTRSGLVGMGARRSEVKEEPTAQPVAGDMSEGGYPSPPSRGAVANVNGDKQWAP